MLNQCNVLYEKDKGIITFKGSKVVFQDRKVSREKPLRVGLGIIEDGTLIDKGNYCFANFKNINSCVPKVYGEITFFKDIGVPTKIEKGKYGNNIFIKEGYLDKVIIKAFDEDGNIIFYENKKIKKDDFEGRNLYFNRINELVENWDDITPEIHKKTKESLFKVNGIKDVSRVEIIEAVKYLLKNNVYKIANGIIIAEGKYEHLAIWNDDNNEISMAWLGRKLKLDSIKKEKINKMFDNLKF